MVDHLNRIENQSYSLVDVAHLNSENELERYLYLFLFEKYGAGLSHRTIKDYKEKLGRFVSVMGNTPLLNIKQEHISFFLITLQTTCKPVSIRCYFDTLSVWFNYLKKKKYIPENPMSGMQKPDPGETIIIPFNEEHISTLLELCDDSFLGIRNRAIILTFPDSGMRLSELSGIMLNDLMLEAGTIKVTGKRNKTRVVGIGMKALKSLVKYIAIRKNLLIKKGIQEHNYLWVSEEGKPLGCYGVQIMVRRLCKRAELTGVRGSPHSFRHTFGTKMLENGANTRDIQLLMGHSTEKMSKTYQKTLDCQWAVSRHKRYSPIDNMKLK